ncbi:hypothetical protein WICMUC_000635 [Wickerhamomyces mucosus]|uniref:Delta 8-(E)-sphingolipid desaturase n=1 Tax=Wickerhamomyces mucosus TaxID=1378264 RepID=A0A9P8PWQ2_9ASCO|nr:hypothetical protein WICMUC_000635 [Wickerhamomyces mucosus]
MEPKILSRSEIEHRISKGDCIVIYKDFVLKLNKWIDYHPGGDKAVHHLVGRDATDEMIAYHSDETQDTFTKWKIGKIQGKWENFLPPIQGGKFRSFVEQKPESISSNISDNSNEDSGCWSTSVSSESTSDCNESTPDPEPEHESYVVPEPSSIVNAKQRSPMAGEILAANIEPLIKQGDVPSIGKLEYYEKKVVKDPSDNFINYDRSLLKEDLETLPSLDYKTQKLLSEEYNKLHDKIIKAGYYNCNYWKYGEEALRIGSLFTISFVLLYFKQYFLSAIAIGGAWQQMVFIAHDAGHISITHQYEVDNIIGMTVASWLGGLSLGWWKRNHNVHHLITNDPVHDPDIQHLPFFAVSSRLFGNVYSTYYEKYLWFDSFAQSLIPIQNYMYYPILCFGRFNLYRLSWEHILLGLGPKRGKAAWFRWYELAGLVFFNWWFFYIVVTLSLPDGWTRFMYIAVSHITTMIVHVQITLSHFAMSTSDLGTSESFPSRQLRTTMDVDCPEWFDYFHGGLQFQAIHHLFPRLPRHNFRAVQPLVIEFCNKVGLHYSIYGFVKGNQVVINKLGEIANQAKILRDCTKSMKKDAIREGKVFDF